jgi:hypothetical protein
MEENRRPRVCNVHHVQTASHALDEMGHGIGRYSHPEKTRVWRNSMDSPFQNAERTLIKASASLRWMMSDFMVLMIWKAIIRLLSKK